MPLAAGRTLSHYEILSPLGAGGMGEVWRARDTKLGREVAIKVLPEELSCEDEHLRRFEREARTLASLNHPNVAQVYGIDEVEDTCFIAMELVPGEDLETRLERGPLRLEEAIDVGRQIAAGLEIAHEAGVVHRDLKPANVRRTPDGDVKVLDFGLAKPVSTSDDRASTFKTQEGRILGTPTYMAPEQLRGAPLDRRVDVWAFGCVLYECLTGERAFPGDTVSDVVAAVLGRSPDLDALPKSTPPRLRELVERCLRKDPRKRLRDVGDARLELEELSERAIEEGRVSTTSTALLAFAVVAALLVAVATGALAARRSGGGEERDALTTRLAMPLPRGVVVDTATGLAPPIAVSPDGGDVAFVAVDGDGARRLFLRGLEDEEPRALRGTEGSDIPFFSPDGTQLGYYDGTDLCLLNLRRGTVETIPVDRPGIRGVSWGEDGSLVLGMFDAGLLEIPVGRGEASTLTTPAPEDDYHASPQILPDGDTVLFTAGMRDGRSEPRIVSRETGEIASFGLIGAVARYLPSGILVYVRSNELHGVRFDLDDRTTIGEPIVLRTGIHLSVQGTPYFAVSENGDLLVHEPARPQPAGRELVWLDRHGAETPFTTGEGFEFPRVSPDGRRVAVALHTNSNTHELWTFDVERGLGTNVTSGGNDLQPSWSLEGDEIVFASAADGDLYHVGLSAGAEPEQLLARLGQQFPLAFTPRGTLLFHELTKDDRWDLFELDVDEGGVRTLVGGEFNEHAGAVSPDGRWLAYVSDETGAHEIYLCSYPDVGLKERLTAGGGVEPVWSPLDGELFFRSGRGLYAVDVGADPGDETPRFGEPRLLFEGDYGYGFYERPNYDVTPDGERFLFVDEGLGLTHGRLDVTLGFADEVERRFSARRQP